MKKYPSIVFIGALCALLPSSAIARIPLQDNPGFIAPVPSTQPLGQVKPKATEFVDDSVVDSDTLDSGAYVSIAGQQFSKFSINVHGSVSERDIKKIVQPYLGKVLSDADIEILTKCLTEYFQLVGFKNSQLQLSPERKHSDTLLIALNAKKNGELIIDRDETKKAHTWEFIIRRNFSSYIKMGDAFNIDSVKKAVTISNQFNPYRITKVTFIPNRQNSDQIDIRLTVIEGNPIQLSPTLDDQGRPNIGIYRAGITFTDKNVTGFGDRLSSSNIFAKGTQATINAYNVPLNGRGDEAFFTYTRNHVDVEPKLHDIDGKTYTYAIGLSHPINQTRTLVASLAYNFRLNESLTNNKTDPGPRGRNRTHFGVVAITFNKNDHYGSTYARVEGALGVSNITHHKGIWRTTMYLNRNVNLPLHNILMFRSIAQLTSDTLPIAQELQLGGAYSVRGYSEGLINADKGYFWSLENCFPIPYLSKASPWLSERVRGAVFVDMGQTWTSINSPRFIPGFSDKAKNNLLLGTGFGVRYRLTRFLTGFTDVGFGLLNRSYLEQNAQPTARVHFGIRSDILPQ